MQGAGCIKMKSLLINVERIHTVVDRVYIPDE
jgi:hypothetical protein